VEFSKRLSKSEAKYKYIGLPKKDRRQFPAKDQIFKIKFKNKEYDMKVNSKDCIMITQLYEAHQFQEGDQVKITKNNNSFVLVLNP
jgi:hypothetical protein